MKRPSSLLLALVAALAFVATDEAVVFEFDGNAVGGPVDFADPLAGGQQGQYEADPDRRDADLAKKRAAPRYCSQENRVPMQVHHRWLHLKHLVARGEETAPRRDRREGVPNFCYN